jgi:hypothetical protein
LHQVPDPVRDCHERTPRSVREPDPEARSVREPG